MIKREMTLKKAEGLNALNAALLVKICCSFKSSIMIRRSGVFINAKSMMGVLSLTAPVDSVLIFEIDGADEKRALKAISEFLAN